MGKITQRKPDKSGASGSSSKEAEKVSDIIDQPSNELWPKPLRIGLFALAVCAVPAILFLFLEIDHVARNAILINFGMSVLGFFLTVRMIPVVVPYVLKRNMFGYDINKRGSPAGEIKM
jgi:UDP-N-acetylglucosamine--dolichyl-phosphate N-acetylglucosaminephosphotransferase